MLIQQINLGDLLIRRWQPEDLIPRWEAMSASFDHLHPWIVGMAELVTLEGQREYSRMVSEWPGTDGAFRYGIFDLDGTVLGGITLDNCISPTALELGYWCHIAHTGRGVITRAAAALTEIALNLPGVNCVEIRCDTANDRSAAIPYRLGYRLEQIKPREPRAPAESGREMCWIKHHSRHLKASQSNSG